MLCAPCPQHTGATQQAVWTCVLLNTLTLAMTCSTYFQLCGNGGAREGLQDSSFLHQAVCMHWLAPIPTRQYPNFSAWMLYGEADDGAGGSSSGGSGGGGGGGLYSSRQAAAAAAAAAAHTPARSSSGFFSGGFSLWGSPPPPPPPPQEFLGPFNASQLAELVSTVSVGPNSGGSVISPVFTMWITLVALYIGTWVWCVLRWCVFGAVGSSSRSRSRHRGRYVVTVHVS